jgi:hypothetical protein
MRGAEPCRHCGGIPKLKRGCAVCQEKELILAEKRAIAEKPEITITVRKPVMVTIAEGEAVVETVRERNQE